MSELRCPICVLPGFCRRDSNGSILPCHDCTETVTLRDHKLLKAELAAERDEARCLKAAHDRERTARLQLAERLEALEALLDRHGHPTGGPDRPTCVRGALCPECSSYRDDGWRPALPPHTPDCLWGQAAANHRARQPVEGRDFEWMP